MHCQHCFDCEMGIYYTVQRLPESHGERMQIVLNIVDDTTCRDMDGDVANFTGGSNREREKI